MYQREKFKKLAEPLMRDLMFLAPQATEDQLAGLMSKIIAAAPLIIQCFDGAEQFPQKDPNQVELPI